MPRPCKFALFSRDSCEVIKTLSERRFVTEFGELREGLLEVRERDRHIATKARHFSQAFEDEGVVVIVACGFEAPKRALETALCLIEISLELENVSE